MAYSFFRDITIDHTKLGSTDLTNYPLVFFGTYTWLKTTGNGGDVTSGSGYDIVFKDAAGSSSLNFERVCWDAATGQVEFHVLVPSVSHTVDTVIRIYYGDSGVTTDQQNRTATWVNFAMVHHYGDPSAISYSDSTSNGNDGAPSATSSAGGFKITAGVGGTSNAHYDVTDAASLEPTELTVGGWFKRAGSSVAYGHLFSKGDGTGAPFGSYKMNFNNADYSDVWFLVGHTDTSYTLLQTGTGQFPDATWIHWVGTYSTISGVAKLYRNGTLVQTSSAAAVPGILYDSVGFRAFSVNTGNYFNGAIDEFRLSNVVRDASWILAEFNNQDDPATFYSVSGSAAPSSGARTSSFFIM